MQVETSKKKEKYPYSYVQESYIGKYTEPAIRKNDHKLYMEPTIPENNLRYKDQRKSRLGIKVSKLVIFDMLIQYERIRLVLTRENIKLDEFVHRFDGGTRCKNSTFGSLSWDMDDDMVSKIDDKLTEGIPVVLSLYREALDIYSEPDGTARKKLKPTFLLSRRVFNIPKETPDNLEAILEASGYNLAKQSIERWT